jgi:ATP-dependent Clp protease ATP-binding subunit ClpA
LPFINEQLEHQQERVARADAERRIARASCFRFDPEDVMALLRHRIVGQDQALAEMEAMLFTVKADFSSRTSPLAVLFFLGPTGVGKTEIVRVLSEAIHGDANHMCRIDMNTLAQTHYSAAITGSPPGYVGSKEGQTLFNIDAIKGSYSAPGIVLFDEIEKASRDVVRAILNVLDTGKLTLTSGAKEIDFTNALIFMTSNIGAKEYSRQLEKYQRGWRHVLGLKARDESKVLDRALHAHFDPEFLNRIERIVPFNRLDASRQHHIIELEIQKLNQRLARKDAQISCDASAISYLSQSYDERFGARGMRRKIRTVLEPLLARAMFDQPEQSEFFASVVNKELRVSGT